MSADILFGQSYFLRFDPKMWRSAQPYPPLGSLYAAAVMRDQGYRVAFFDAMLAASEAEWEEALRRHRPQYAVLFEDNFNYLSKMCLGRMRQAAFKMCALASSFGCEVIVCGADATDHARLYFAQGADFVLRGEGEQTLIDLINALSGRSDIPLDRIAGLNRPGEGGIEIANPARPPLADLDFLPFPAWDLADLDRYRKIWIENHGYFSLNMVTTRGCPYRCNWCAKPIWGNRYNCRSPHNVAAEMRFLKERYAPDHVWFADDIFGLKPGWIDSFAREVAALEAKIPFKCLMRADLLEDRVTAALKNAGCESVWIGAESGSQKILDAMDKGTTVEQIGAAARLLRCAGIRVGFFLQFGYPGETMGDIWKTVRMVRNLKPDMIGTSVSYPLPGTVFYERVKRELGQKRHWEDSQDLAMLYRGAYTTSYYRALHRWLNEDFNLQASWNRFKTSVSAPKAAAVAYHGLNWCYSRTKMELRARAERA